jgi:hypothetical protein
VGTVLALNTCGNNAPVWNNWYEFSRLGSMGIMGEGFRVNGEACIGNLAVANEGTTPVFNNVPCGKNFYIRAYPSTRLDIGKKITIFGIDSNGQTIRTKRDGILLEGVDITMAVPFASTSILVREITRVIKQDTQGVVRLYQYDPENDVLHDCAVYDPYEETPDYRFTRITGSPAFARGCCGCHNSENKTIKGLVKLQFVPVRHDTDLVQIENIDAVALMIQGIRAREGTKPQTADSMEAAAVRELNLELRNRFPVEQTPITINPFGTAIPARHAIGRII